MPRLVDHEQRRRQITDAARRVITRGGMEAATFQSVAAEAGISVRLVQYYFGTKKDFLMATHRAVIDDSAARFTDRITAGGPITDPREIVRTVAYALLPLDEASRADALVNIAFHVAGLTGSEIVSEDLLAPPRLLVATLTDVLSEADPDRAATAELDAGLILGALVGLTQSMLAGHHSADEARRFVDHLLDRIPGTAR